MDKNEVLTGLRTCTANAGKPTCPEDCPYFLRCFADDKEIMEDLARHALALLEPQPARLLTLEEARIAKGIGWEEVWLEADEEMPESIELFECAFIGGHIICADGDIGQVLTDTYGKPYNSRLWAGNFPPTDEQRKAEPWDR